LQIWEEWLANMLTIKAFSSFFCEFGHLQFVNLKAFALDGIEDFAHVLVGAWFDHAEGSRAASFLSASSSKITISYNIKHSAKDGNLSSNIQIRKLNSGNFNSLKEYLLNLLIVHFNRVIAWVIKESVVSNDVSLWIIPFAFEDVSLFLDWLGEGHIDFI